MKYYTLIVCPPVGANVKVVYSQWAVTCGGFFSSVTNPDVYLSHSGLRAEYETYVERMKETYTDADDVISHHYSFSRYVGDHLAINPNDFTYTIIETDPNSEENQGRVAA